MSQLLREFPSTEIPRPLESGIQFDGYLGWDLTESDVKTIEDLEARYQRVTVQIIEPLIPTAIWTVHKIFAH